MWAAVAAQSGPWAGWVLFGALAIYITRSVVRGHLIPRSTHVDRMADLKAAIAALEETVDEQKAQIGILLGYAREPRS